MIKPELKVEKQKIILNTYQRTGELLDSLHTLPHLILLWQIS